MSEPSVFGPHEFFDSRGCLRKVFCKEREVSSDDKRFVVKQVNLTQTTGVGVVRGLHFQSPPMSEVKLVTCLKGAIWDVVVDLRKGSPTFLNWFAFELTSENRLTLVVPQGFAHGLQTLAPDCQLLYLHNNDYSADQESGLNAIDPALDITWPLHISLRSERDHSFPYLDETFEGLILE